MLATKPCRLLLAVSLLSSMLTRADADSITIDIDALVADMTLEQKVGQVIQPEIKHASPSDVARYSLGSVLNGGGSFPGGNKRASVSDWRDLAADYRSAALRLENGIAIAPIWGTDAVHGHNNVYGATVFPHNIGLGAAGSPELVGRIGVATAREVAATGIDWVFAPTVAVAQDYRWGRTYESFGANPTQVSQYGEALVRGFEREGIATTAKHFLGDGGTESGIDQGDVRLPLEVLRATHLSAYDGAFSASVPSVMASFNSWNGAKVHGSRSILTELLRDEVGFDGLVVSDWNGIGQVAGCSNDDCAQAFNAGIDMIMVPKDWRDLRKSLLKQVQRGDITEARLDEAVKRILAMKLRYGLIATNGESPPLRPMSSSVVGSADHRELAREAVRKSLVLLKNETAVLPIKGAQRIAVLGSGADSLTMQTGGWSLTWQGDGNNNADFPNATTILAGFEALAPKQGATVVTDVSDADIDIAVVVFGEQPYAEGAGDIMHLDFGGSKHPDLALMQDLQRRGVPVVGVFLTGRPLWVNPEINASDAFVVAWLPGSEGAGVAEVLLQGSQDTPQFNFTGRLPFSWPAVDVNSLDKRLPVDQFLWNVGDGLSYGTDAPLGSLSEVSVSANSPTSDYVIYRRKALAPFGMFVGDEGEWVMPVPGASATSSLGELTVSSLDVRVQEDAKRITWSGAGIRDSQFYFKTNSDSGVDLRSLAAEGGALSVIINMVSSPKGKVAMRMDCGWPCRGELDVSKLFKRLPENQWVRLSFPLECFEEAGTDLSKVNGPMVMVTNRAMSLVLLDAAIVQNPDKDSMVPCK